MSAVAVRPRSAAVLALASVGGLLMFAWPLLLGVPAGASSVQPPFLFAAILPVLVLVCLAELTEDGMDAKVLAVLGVLTAVNAVLRSLGAGIAGIETVFFLLVLAGRVFGPGFGFVLGCTSIFASGLLTGGIGPWLPFQMVAAAWVGLGAGLLPRRLRGRAEIAVLVAYGVVAAYGFGLLMNLWGWPLALGIELPGHEGGLGYVAGAPLLDNLQRFGVYTLLTSTGGWDTGRAISTAVAIVVLGPAVLHTLRRAARRAVVTRLSEQPAGPAPRRAPGTPAG